MTPKQILIAYQTIIIKELVRCFRIWPQTIMPPAITMALYFLIFGKLVGSQIHAVQGFTYMQYIVPRLIMMSVIMNSYVNSSSSFFSMKFQKSIEEILISPTPNVIILLGFVTGGVVRGCRGRAGRAGRGDPGAPRARCIIRQIGRSRQVVGGPYSCTRSASERPTGYLST